MDDFFKYLGFFAAGVAACKLALGLWKQQDCQECRRTLDDLKQVIFGLEEMIKLNGIKEGLTAQMADKIIEVLKYYWQNIPHNEATKDSTDR